jgi:hypothetical protein
VELASYLSPRGFLRVDRARIELPETIVARSKRGFPSTDCVLGTPPPGLQRQERPDQQ